jgi:hypothetical protein
MEIRMDRGGKLYRKILAIGRIAPAHNFPSSLHIKSYRGSFIIVKYGKFIISTLLLGIYCLAVFHNFIPHFHVDHGAAAHSQESETVDHAHSHGHAFAHAHHDEEATDLAGLDLIIALFGHLGHSGHADTGEHHLENYSAKVQQRSLTKLLEMTPWVTVNEFSPALPGFKTPQLAHSPPIPSQEFLFGSCPLRGPPSFS